MQSSTQTGGDSAKGSIAAGRSLGVFSVIESELSRVRALIEGDFFSFHQVFTGHCRLVGAAHPGRKNDDQNITAGFGQFVIGIGKILR